ncbi:hypothetical protein FGRMN_5239 [Fusarium graminum]|nr:hypothetical protein FGRMN_5239 [Fusarium graminum]
MVTTKLLVAVLAAHTQASPVAAKNSTQLEADLGNATETRETEPQPTRFYGTDFLAWADINVDAFKNESNWCTEANEEVVIKDTFTHPACKQDECPDYHAPFDLMYTLDADFEPRYLGQSLASEKNVFASNSVIRVGDCDRCMVKQVGTGLFGEVPGGCWEFDLCDRPQTICIDPGNTRAHHVWRDSGDKKCYHMRIQHLGRCFSWRNRILLLPDAEVPCDW